MHHTDSAAHISHLVRNGRDENARSGKNLLKARFLALSQMVRCINDQGGQARSGRSAIRRKKYVSQEHLARIALTARLHLSSEYLVRFSDRRH